MLIFLLLVQICLLHQSILTANTIFKNLDLPHFSIQGKISPCKKLYKSRVHPGKNVSQTDGEADRWTENGSNLIGPLLQRWRFDNVFRKFINNIFFKIIWLDCELYRKNQYRKGIQTNTTSFSVQRVQNKTILLANLCKIIFILFDWEPILRVYFVQKLHVITCPFSNYFHFF